MVLVKFLTNCLLAACICVVAVLINMVTSKVSNERLFSFQRLKIVIYFSNNINLEKIVDQFNVNFYQSLVAGEADKGLVLTEEQKGYLFQKSTDLNEDIKMELTDRVIDYLDKQRKEA